MHEPALSAAGIHPALPTHRPNGCAWPAPTRWCSIPGPMIRGLEIDPAVADGPQSAVLEQVTNGLAVRMALLYHLIGGAPADAPHPAKDRSNASD